MVRQLVRFWTLDPAGAFCLPAVAVLYLGGTVHLPQESPYAWALARICRYDNPHTLKRALLCVHA